MAGFCVQLQAVHVAGFSVRLQAVHVAGFSVQLQVVHLADLSLQAVHPDSCGWPLYKLYTQTAVADLCTSWTHTHTHTHTHLGHYGLSLKSKNQSEDCHVCIPSSLGCVHSITPWDHSATPNTLLLHPTQLCLSVQDRHLPHTPLCLWVVFALPSVFKVFLLSCVFKFSYFPLCLQVVFTPPCIFKLFLLSIVSLSSLLLPTCHCVVDIPECESPVTGAGAVWVHAGHFWLSCLGLCLVLLTEHRQLL